MTSSSENKIPFRIDDLTRGLILFRTSNNAHGYTNVVILSERVEKLPQVAKDELAQIMRNIAEDLSPAARTAESYDPEISVTCSLLQAAVNELREWKVGKGGDDQVVLNLEAAMANAGYVPDAPQSGVRRKWPANFIAVDPKTGSGA